MNSLPGSTMIAGHRRCPHHLRQQRNRAELEPDGAAGSSRAKWRCLVDQPGMQEPAVPAGTALAYAYVLTDRTVDAFDSKKVTSSNVSQCRVKVPTVEWTGIHAEERNG